MPIHFGNGHSRVFSSYFPLQATFFKELQHSFLLQYLPSYSLRFYVHACLPTFMYVYHVHAWYLQRPEEGFGCPGPGVVGAPEPPCRNWEQNLGLCRNC